MSEIVNQAKASPLSAHSSKKPFQGEVFPLAMNGARELESEVSATGANMATTKQQPTIRLVSRECCPTTAIRIDDKIFHMLSDAKEEIVLSVPRSFSEGLRRDGWLRMERTRSELSERFEISPDGRILTRVDRAEIGKIIGEHGYIRLRTIVSAAMRQEKGVLLHFEAPEGGEYQVSLGNLAELPNEQECWKQITEVTEEIARSHTVNKFEHIASTPCAARSVVLSNTSPGGAPRYDLPGFLLGEYMDHNVIWRPAPAPVIHHGKGKEFILGHSELILVPNNAQYTLAISVDTEGMPKECYVNINLVPRSQARGWSWEDLELDIKLTASFSRTWEAMLLDVDEFEEASLSGSQRRIACDEVARVYDAIEKRTFPFASPSEAWLGLPVNIRPHCSIE